MVRLKPIILGAQDTYYVRYIKGVGKINQQTFIDTYVKIASAKLYYRKIALVAADMLNDSVVPFYDSYGIPLMRILTDRGTEYCGARDHDYQLYLALENIDHIKTKAKSPQTNGICERFHRTMQDEFYAIAFRKKIFNSIEELQKDVDVWLEYYNNHRPYSGKYCYGKTPMQTWKDSLHLVHEKQLDNHYQKVVSLPVSDQTEPGSGGDQPARDSLTDWNGQRELIGPSFPDIIPGLDASENASKSRLQMILIFSGILPHQFFFDSMLQLSVYLSQQTWHNR